MKPFTKLGDAIAPDGTVLSLYAHDGAYQIRVDGVELMSTRRHNSEDALAGLACGPLREQRGARVLIGGLGLGFTLKAALRLLARDAHVVVAELVAAVIEWNRNPRYALSTEAMSDPRVEMRHDDVSRVLKDSPGTFDAILLDIDNGAEALTTKGNAYLYRSVGIHLAAAALRPGGRLAYWSAVEDAAFASALREAGLTVTITSARAHVTSGPWHSLFVAQHRDARVPV